MKETDPNGLAPDAPGAKLDAGKVQPRLIYMDMSRALYEVSKVATYGAKKYTPQGWITVPDGVNRYTDALFRHLNREGVGEIFDRDTQLSHAAHAAWNALARLDLMIREAENNG